MNDHPEFGPPGDSCSSCGRPTYPARDGVCDDNICKDCNDRLEAELDEAAASMTPEERAEHEAACERIWQERIKPLLDRRRKAVACFTPDAARFVARKLHDQGVEMTPDQVAEARDSGLAKVRAALTAKGWDLPADDVGLLAMMQQAWKAQNGGRP